jgi:hypothetical protein
MNCYFSSSVSSPLRCHVSEPHALLPSLLAFVTLVISALCWELPSIHLNLDLPPDLETWSICFSTACKSLCLNPSSYASTHILPITATGPPGSHGWDQSTLSSLQEIPDLLLHCTALHSFRNWRSIGAS